ncbi:MAG: DUF4276 family protein [Elusimicrobia bacterium]|nr:DUF4276 family protein [Elusimicrobiota bacterium]
MQKVNIAAIVEGHGECAALPELVRRVAHEIDPGFVPTVLSPMRVPAAKLMKEGELERAVDFVGRKLGGPGGIIILVDCDDGCPAKEGPKLLKRAMTARKDVLVSVIFAKKEFESWFLASANSLRGKRDLSTELSPPADPESIRDAKKWLSMHMPHGRSYSETADQPALTCLFDMQAARRADSFDKCYREIRKMLERLRNLP